MLHQLTFPKHSTPKRTAFHDISLLFLIFLFNHGILENNKKLKNTCFKLRFLLQRKKKPLQESPNPAEHPWPADLYVSKILLFFLLEKKKETKRN